MLVESQWPSHTGTTQGCLRLAATAQAKSPFRSWNAWRVLGKPVTWESRKSPPTDLIPHDLMCEQNRRSCHLQQNAEPILATPSSNAASPAPSCRQFDLGGVVRHGVMKLGSSFEPVQTGARPNQSERHATWLHASGFQSDWDAVQRPSMTKRHWSHPSVPHRGRNHLLCS